MSVNDFMEFYCLTCGGLAPFIVVYIVITRFVNWIINAFSGRRYTI